MTALRVLFWIRVHFRFEVVEGVTFDFISFSEVVHESQRIRVFVFSWFLNMVCTLSNPVCPVVLRSNCSYFSKIVGLLS